MAALPSAADISGRISGLAVRTSAVNASKYSGPSAAPAASSPQETSLLTSITGDIGTLKGLAATNAANATGATTQAAGYSREAEAYDTVGGIADENAKIEGISGNIKQLQLNRGIQRTLGAQRASVAAAGFASSGSSLDIMKSSIQEGYLADQLIRTQSSVTQGGYLEQGAAARAEGAGARVASTAATALAQSYAAAGATATANAANETSALSTYLAGRPATPESALVTSTLAGDPNFPTTFTPPASSTQYAMSDYQIQGQQQISGQTPSSLIGQNFIGNISHYNPVTGV